MVMHRKTDLNSTPECHEAEDKEMPLSDLYFLLDGGKYIVRGNGEIGTERMGIERGKKEFNRMRGK